MEEIVLFVLTFLFVFILYQIFVVRKMKKLREDIHNKNMKKEFKEVIEISYLVNIYHIDKDRINYNQLLQIVSIVSSIDIALVVTIISNLPNYFLEIIVGLISMIVIIFVSYYFVYLFYKKKGLIKK